MSAEEGLDDVIVTVAAKSARVIKDLSKNERGEEAVDDVIIKLSQGVVKVRYRYTPAVGVLDCNSSCGIHSEYKSVS